MKRFSAVSFALFLAVALITPASFANDKKNDPDEIGNRDVGKGVNFYSLEKEIAIGKQLAQEVERQAKIVDDPVVAEYVNRLGQNLVRNSDAKVPFTIKVLDSEEVNAFALPGGFFFVNSGLILNATTLKRAGQTEADSSRFLSPTLVAGRRSVRIANTESQSSINRTAGRSLHVTSWMRPTRDCAPPCG